jgi:hypothetical protein
MNTNILVSMRRHIVDGERPFKTSLEAKGTVDIVFKLCPFDYDVAECPAYQEAQRPE